MRVIENENDTVHDLDVKAIDIKWVSDFSNDETYN